MTTSLLSAGALVLLDVAFRRLLQRLAISFPSSLAGCGVLFATLLVVGDSLYNLFRPGAALLAKWLPVFFVPSLVTLPLADGLGSSLEYAKALLVVVGGFYFTLLTTAGSVLGIRKVFSSSSASSALLQSDTEITSDKSDTEITSDSPTPAPKPFSDALTQRLQWVTALTAASAVISSKLPSATVATTPLTSLCLLSTTLYTFVVGARLPKKITKIVHPLVTCTALTWTVMKLLGFGLHQSFYSLLRSYRTPYSPLSGAGNLLLFLLGPSVVSFACQMYDRRKLMRENLPEVATAVGVSSVGGLFGTALAVRLLNIGNPLVRLALLSRNITSPLAMAIAGILGADVSLAVSMVVITGLLGANFGASILDSFGIKDAVARGLGIGAAAHGLGTAAFANEEDAFPFAAIAMALTASACTVLVSIPVVKRTVLQLSLGI